ncbi:MAG: DUF3368 domain-containing protein [Candidatus Aminicenantes bacterium]|jgi:predicted nucleic acid-binding protein
MPERKKIVINTGPVPGRRIARLHNLKLTGSVGILVRAKNEGFSFSMREAIQKMKQQGVWLSDEVVAFALSDPGEK